MMGTILFSSEKKGVTRLFIKMNIVIKIGKLQIDSGNDTCTKDGCLVNLVKNNRVCVSREQNACAVTYVSCCRKISNPR